MAMSHLVRLVFDVAMLDEHEPVGGRVRQRPQEHGLDHGEERGVGADAERQGEDRSGGERGFAHEHAQGVADVASNHDEQFLSRPGG